MKKILLILLSITLINARAQEPDCKKFREGTFKIEAKDGLPEITIIRKGKKQIEKSAAAPGDAVFLVTWVNECIYTLIPTEKTRAMYPGIPKNGILTVKITGVKAHSYLQTSTSNFSEMVYTSEVIKVE